MIKDTAGTCLVPAVKVLNEMSDKVKKSLVMQGSILALAGIVSKIIGFLYRIPMANLMGNTGNGLYSVAFGIYNVALTLSSYSMHLAISKLMSERLSKKENKNAHRLFYRAFLLAVVTGGLACAALYFGAEQLAVIYRKEGLERPLRVLAPTTFLVALLGTLRGYYQGHRNMVPTAVSQVLEQIVNAIVSVVATAAFVASCPSVDETASYGAMGGTFGTLAGAGTALLMFLFLFIKDRKQRKEERNQSDEADEENKLIWKAIFLTVFPVILSQTIYQLGYTIDDYVFGNLMRFRGVDAVETTNLQGIFNTQYNQMINLPVAIATAMAAATLPNIVASYAVKEYQEVRKKIDSVFKINLLLAIPAMSGLAALAEPIMGVLFPRLEDYHIVAVNLLFTGSSAVLFYALSTLSTSILQGCNRMRIPVVHSAVALVIHVFLISLLLYFTDLGVYALIIGNVTFPLTVSVLNLLQIRKLLHYQLDSKNMIVKPLVASFVMGMAAWGTYQVLISKIFVFLTQKTAMICALILAILVAVVVYAGMLLALKSVSREELKQMPVIGKLVR